MTDINVQKLARTEGSDATRNASLEQRHERIRERAFALWQARVAGADPALDDWLRAERDIGGAPSELRESEREYALRTALPGFEAADIHVEATAHELHIRARRHAREDGSGAQLCWTEWESTDIHRLVHLPQAIDVTKVSASLQHGMLQIRARKANALPAEVSRAA